MGREELQGLHLGFCRGGRLVVPRLRLRTQGGRGAGSKVEGVQKGRVGILVGGRRRKKARAVIQQRSRSQALVLGLQSGRKRQWRASRPEHGLQVMYIQVPKQSQALSLPHHQL